YIIYKTNGTSFHKIAWNIDLVNNHPEKVTGKNIFMGSSLVQEGVSDSLLSESGIPSLNCATNGNGNEMVLYFLKRLLPLKPNAIYLQLYKTDKTGLHNLTPMILTPFELLLEGQSINFLFIQYVFKRPYYIVDYLIWKLVGAEKVQVKQRDYGQVSRDSSFYTPSSFAAIDTNDMKDYFNFFRPELVNYTLVSEEGKEGFQYELKRLARRMYFDFRNLDFVYNGKTQTNFVSEAFDLCAKNNVPVKRLYIPLLADVKINKDFDESFYVPTKNKNILSLKSFTFLDSVIYWGDRAHLSKQGSMLFSQELLRQHLLK
ncbi:MAG: hypothetical protein JNL60_05815, partial [Bacteroidia bacterium]|nr:hypothetical protein [Bacteroidia bacterium]